MTRTTLAREGVTIVGGDGSSFENAIVVHAADLQRAFIGAYEYILLRYRLLQFSTVSIVRYRGNHYHVITFNDVTTIGPFPHQKKRVFYFDMSDYYAKKPSSTAKPSAKAVPKKFP
jgi:hypothetical protein